MYTMSVNAVDRMQKLNKQHQHSHSFCMHAVNRNRIIEFLLKHTKIHYTRMSIEPPFSCHFVHAQCTQCMGKIPINITLPDCSNEITDLLLEFTFIYCLQLAVSCLLWFIFSKISYKNQCTQPRLFSCMTLRKSNQSGWKLQTE